MEQNRIRKRITVCVDGTWYNQDGQEGQGKGNNSNISRVSWSAKRGTFTDKDGRPVKQIDKYFHGIGVGRFAIAKLNDGISGEGCDKQIQDVYKYCVKEIEGPEDEIWLFGFSRGAYVVRAVAKMLCGGVVPELQDSAFKSFRNMTLGRHKYSNRGERYGREYSEQIPIIKFLGLFDSVQMTTNAYDATIYYEERIENIRHAMALNENRRLRPLLDATDGEVAVDGSRSFVQAWFIGCHEDLGGGALHDGLALYPLQWMLHEARECGLVLDHASPNLPQLIEDPLTLVFPESSFGGPIEKSSSGEILPWRFGYSNGLVVSMYDLRAVHRDADLGDQRHKLVKRSGQSAQATHNIRLNPGQFDSLKLGERSVFGEDVGKLNGYTGTSRSGTIIHPSVYFLTDSYWSSGLASGLKGLQSHLEVFREKAALQALEEGGVTPSQSYPWIKDFSPTVAVPSCRILICGDTGVGKSTLLNRVFGMPMTNVSSQERGTHDIENGFRDANHPGIIVHDSEGFQAGGTQEVKAFTKFLEKRSGRVPSEEKLHAIWFCIESNSSRPVQAGMANVFAGVAKVAPSIPIVIVCTKKDMYLTSRAARFSYDDLDAICGKDISPDDPLLDRQREFLDSRQREIEELIARDELTRESYPQLQNVRFQFVLGGEEPRNPKEHTLYDSRSIRELVQKTAESIDDGLIADGMIAAQIQDLEAKIDLAIERTLRFLRRAIINSSLGTIVLLSSTIGTPTIARLLCDDIVTGCYGIPKKMAKEAEGLLHRIVGGNVGKFVAQSIGTLFGAIPLAAGAPLLEAPAAARVVLKCACDLTLVLDRAFRMDGAGKFVSYDKLRTVALGYVTGTGTKQEGRNVPPRRRLVHKAVNDLIPMVSTLAFTGRKDKNVTRYRMGLKKIIMDHRLDDNEWTTTISDSDIEGRISNATTLSVDEEEELELAKELKITKSSG
ncbi:hypothetical protein SCUP515_02716 [Seiridium cupressi]